MLNQFKLYQWKNGRVLFIFPYSLGPLWKLKSTEKHNAPCRPTSVNSNFQLLDFRFSPIDFGVGLVRCCTDGEEGDLVNE